MQAHAQPRAAMVRLLSLLRAGPHPPAAAMPAARKALLGRRKARCCPPSAAWGTVLPGLTHLVASQRSTDHTCSRESDIPGDEAAVKRGAKRVPPTWRRARVGGSTWRWLSLSDSEHPHAHVPPSEYLCFVAILMVSLH